MSSSQPARKRLPVNPSIEHLKKQAKRRVKLDPSLQLAAAQHQLATEYGCRNWAELAHVVETMSRGADQLVNVKHDYEPLPAAARKRDLAMVRQILDAGAFTPHDLDAGLAHAAWYGGGAPEVLAVRKQIFDLLLEHGADPDGQYGSNYGPIVFGCGECVDPDGLRWLLDAGCDVTFTPVETKYGGQCALSYAFGTYARGQNDRKHQVIEMLLAAGAFVPPEITPSILAIHRGDAKALEAMIDEDAALLRRTFRDMPYGNMSLFGATLLHCAVEFDEIECIDLLLNRLADLNARAEVIDGVGGQTPVFHAIGGNRGPNNPTLEYLVKRAGASIDMTVQATFKFFGETQTRPVTPLEFAVLSTDPATPSWRQVPLNEIALLLEAGADPKRGGENGVTALHHAANFGSAALVELLLRHGAKEWQPDQHGKTALDYARESKAADRQQIIELLDRPVIRDSIFKAAVKAIQTGDLPALKQLLKDHPNLVHDRAVEPDCYPRDYFRDPKLLWFVANNLIHMKTMPANIVSIAEAIIDAGAERDDLDYTLGLVMTGNIAREQGHQIPLMKLLLARGAKPDDLLGVMAHRELEAVKFLLSQGLPLSAPIAAALGRIEEMPALLASANTKEKQNALAMAVINQQVDAARLCLDAGADANAFFPEHAHSHSLPVHQAAVNDDVEMLRLLVERGAKLDIVDKLWNGTPLGWAIHTGKRAAEAYLRSVRSISSFS